MRRPRTQISWSDPNIGPDKAQKDAAPAMANLVAQATTPEQKELLAKLEGTFIAKDEDAIEKAEKAMSEVPDGFEAQPGGGYLCIACTEGEGNPLVIKRLQDIGRHSGGGTHQTHSEAYN